MEDNRSVLQRALGRTDIMAIGFGTMVGWSWVILGSSWAENAGFLGAILAFVIGGLIVLSVGAIYGELATALPVAGGGFAYAYRAFNSAVAFLTGWIMLFAYLGVAAWESIAFSTAVNYLIPFHNFIPMWEIAGYQVYFSWAIVGSIGAFIIMMCHIHGLKFAALMQVMATGVVLIVVLIVFLGGVTFGDFEYVGPVFKGFNGFFYVLLMVPAMLIGFDVIPQSSEEMNIETNDIGRMIILCITLSLLWYILLIIGTSFGAPGEIGNAGNLPVADIAAFIFGSNTFAIVVVIGGLFGIMTTWFGFYLSASRLIFAMSRVGMLPEVFSRPNKKANVPTAALVAIGVICMLVPFLGENALIWMVDTSSICSILSYIFVVVIYMILNKKEPNLQRPYKVPFGNKMSVFILVLVSIYFLLYIFNANQNAYSSMEFLVIGLWILIGAICYAATSNKRKMMSGEEVEFQLYGSKYSRKIEDNTNSEAGGSVE